MRLVERGETTAVAAGEQVVPASLEQQVKALQRLVGKQAMTIEILEAARGRSGADPVFSPGSKASNIRNPIGDRRHDCIPGVKPGCGTLPDPR